MSEENHCGDELNQAAMDESPAQAPTATQVWPAPSKVQFGKSSIFQAGSWIQEKSFAPGAGEFPGAGDEAAGGAADSFLLLLLLVFCSLACCDCLCFEQHLS